MASTGANHGCRLAQTRRGSKRVGHAAQEKQGSVAGNGGRAVSVRSGTRQERALACGSRLQVTIETTPAWCSEAGDLGRKGLACGREEK